MKNVILSNIKGIFNNQFTLKIIFSWSKIKYNSRLFSSSQTEDDF